MEQLLITIFEVLLTFPGAFLLWLFFIITGNKKDFKECLKEHYTLNSFLGLALISGVIILIRYWF